LCGRGLSSGTPWERIAPESLTPVGSGFVHRNISRGGIPASLDQVYIMETSKGRGLNVLSFEDGASRIRSDKESTGIQLAHRHLVHRHSGAMRSIEPGISKFPDAQLRICGLVLRTIPE
jgi:hypothetical protein